MTDEAIKLLEEIKKNIDFSSVKRYPTVQLANGRTAILLDRSNPEDVEWVNSYEE